MRHLPILVLAALPACGGGGGGGAIVNELAQARIAMLQGLGPNVFVPTFQRLATEAAELRDALLALQASPSAQTLQAAQDAWRDARSAWNSAEMFMIGPEDDLFLAAKVDIAVIDAPRIEDEIAGSAVLNEAHIEGLGSTRKGFFAIEYLLFDPDGDNGAVLAALTGSARRLQYLVALGQNLAKIADQIRDIWAATGQNFVNDLVNAGSAGSAYASTKAAEDDIVNRMLFFVENVADVRLGRPIGKTSGGILQPPGAEAERSGNSKQDLLDDLRGLKNLYEGTFESNQTVGFTRLVRARAETIDNAMRQGIDELIAAVEAIPGPLETSDAAIVEAAFDKAKTLKLRIVLDLAASLNTTLTFSPFDGD